MSSYRGRPFSPVESQMDLMKSHSIRPAAREPKSDGGRTLQLAVPAGWTSQAKCIGDFARFDESVGLSAGQAAQLCAGCPVIQECRSAALEQEHGLSAGNRYGVRGGMSPKERAAIVYAERKCERGHSGRWTESRKRKFVYCLECMAEDKRKAYEERRLDPEFMERRARELRERRAAQMVTCLDCKAEMRTTSFKRHRELRHEERAA